MAEDNNKGLKIIGAIFLVCIILISFSLMREMTKRKPGTPVPATKYALTTGEVVTEFNTLDGTRCIMTETAMTCHWGQ